MEILVAPDAFKGSLAAATAALAMARGIHSSLPGAAIRLLPIADGGDGSIDALVSAGYERRPVTTRGPTGLPVAASYAWRDGTAVVELANTCGLLLLPDGRLEPLASSTAGLGDAVRAALDAGASSIIICLGGGASTDGGTGMLVALGAVISDASGCTLEPSGAALEQIANLDLDALHPRIADVEFTVASDVQSPLFGPHGAAFVFAPQKGADADDVARLDAGLRNWSGVLSRTTGREVSDLPGSGAAGGTAAAAMAALGAVVHSGAEVIASAVGLADALANADLVVTGEGRLDAQSLLGKGAMALVRAARTAGVPSIVVAGRIDLSAVQLTAEGVAAWASVRDLAHSDDDAMARAAELLEQATATAIAAPPRRSPRRPPRRP